MNIFSKKKSSSDAVASFSPPDQTPMPAKEEVVNQSKEEVLLLKVLQNQVTIVANQQTILDYITSTQQLIMKLATEGVESPMIEKEQEPEPSPEELRELLLRYRSQKKSVVEESSDDEEDDEEEEYPTPTEPIIKRKPFKNRGRPKKVKP